MTSKFNNLLISKRQKYIPVVYNDFVTPDTFLDEVAKHLKQGADVIELRGKNVSAADFLNVAQKVRELTSIFDALLIVHDRIDIAKIIEAEGITLDNNTIDIKSAKKIIEDSMLIGYICKNPNEIAFAMEAAADFVVTDKKYTDTNIKAFIIN